MKLHSSTNVLLLGSGGREHAFAWKLEQSARISKLYIAPGNAGTSSCGTNVDIELSNFGGIKQFILTNNINLVVVGPEKPLVDGLYDHLADDDEIHVPVIGPSKLGAMLEGSKDFAKEFMNRHNIPTAKHLSVTEDNIDEGIEFLESLNAPYVLKADGLAAGKGVLIIDSLEEAKGELRTMLDGKFGSASSTVLIEEHLDGIEFSAFVATDGKNYKILPTAKDYKRIGDGDTGLNTGGMGAIAPVPFVDEEMMERVRRTIIEPTVKGLEEEDITYRGFIFLGIMCCGDKPYVIEYNVRMGDPETQAVFPLIENDIIDLFEAIAFGSLDKFELKLSDKIAAAVVCCAEGYPDDNYRRGDAIEGLESAAGLRSIIFQAGTESRGDETYTKGGRVLTVTSLGDSIEEALQKSYETIECINYKGKYCRTDIGKDLM